MSRSDPIISAIICTHNPRTAFLQRVLAALEAQTLPRNQWELIVVDSGSTPSIARRQDLRLPVFTRVIRVDQPGLALARRAGSLAALAPLLASVDDDTVFRSDYLETAVRFMQEHPEVASCGGKFIAEFETPPPPWFHGFDKMIAIRDLGDDPIVVPGLRSGEKLCEFPEALPIGVNVTRRAAYESYLRRWEDNSTHADLGRSGKSLASGEDNDYSLCCLEDGWALAYVPRLQSLHLIPASRLASDYLGRLNRASCRSWVRVLHLHGIRPWRNIPCWTVPLRQFKAWFTLRAWRGPAAWVRWQGACGQIEGRAEISHDPLA